MAELDKEAIIKILVKKKEVVLEDKKAQLELIERQMENASRSLSTNPETENDKKAYRQIAAEIKRGIEGCQEAVEILKSFSAGNTEIGAGALVELSMGKKGGLYLVIPKADVCPVPTRVKRRKLNFVSVQSPVGQAISGLRAGDKTTTNVGAIEIISVQ